EELDRIRPAGLRLCDGVGLTDVCADRVCHDPTVGAGADSRGRAPRHTPSPPGVGVDVSTPPPLPRDVPVDVPLEPDTPRSVLGRARMTPREQLRAGRLPRRLTQLFIGLTIFGLSMAMLIRAGLGMIPWDVFHYGVATHVPLSFG